MIQLGRQFFIYFVAGLTLLFTFKALPDAPLSWRVVEVAIVLIAVVCAVFAWDEVIKGKVLPSHRNTSEDVSVSLSLKRAMSSVILAARNDESIALEANNIVRRGLDKGCIKYEKYKIWRLKNPMIFTAVTDADGHLIGFFDVFPLTDQAAGDLVSGKLHEHNLTIDSILPAVNNEQANKIYIASIMVNPRQTEFSTMVAKDVVVLKLSEFLLTTFPPNETRKLFAFAHTQLGEHLLKNTTFKNTALPKDNKHHRPLYELSPVEYQEMAKDLKGLIKAHIKGVHFHSAK
jgi:hypothetical protein